ncbi:uncharacterized protein LOC123552923 [Mercenaria mercenaria]|uniref:uncharacterized protein LOC123552923 n=1 Tax=Mercenaria mercenaria TaxID=6596 RepID=UPI00234F06FD|nr:uncharacterized protein LOC123552923 [Mercenaria mercenaria]
MVVPIFILRKMYQMIGLPIDEKLSEYLNTIILPYYNREAANEQVFDPLLGVEPGNHGHYLKLSRDGAILFIHTQGFQQSQGRTLNNLVQLPGVKKGTHRFDRPRQAFMVPMYMMPVNIRQHISNGKYHYYSMLPLCFVRNTFNI